MARQSSRFHFLFTISYRFSLVNLPLLYPSLHPITDFRIGILDYTYTLFPKNALESGVIMIESNHRSIFSEFEFQLILKILPLPLFSVFAANSSSAACILFLLNLERFDVLVPDFDHFAKNSSKTVLFLRKNAVYYFSE